MKKNNINQAFLMLFALILMGWGYRGHQIINENSALSFNSEMENFHQWVSNLVTYASAADDRKDVDPDEGPRHYIDIDLYDSFLESGTIPQDIDNAIAEYGYNFVYDAGVLPWATIKTYDSLVNSMKRLDWDTAVMFAADLGHYVADGHNPLHITKNYNGQFSNNYGIHSRYESTMINSYGSQIVYNGDEVSFIQDINQYVFDYLYFNYTYLDSVLAADDYAKSINSNTSSSEYKAALWEFSSGFTTMLFNNASHTLAEMIYSAWVEAGKPVLFTGPFISSPEMNITHYLEQNVPNPFSLSTHIVYDLPSDMDITLEIKDNMGKTVTLLQEGIQSKGKHQLEWEPGMLSEGIYFLVLKSDRGVELKKLMHLD